MIKPVEARKCLMKILNKDPNQRPSLNELIMSDWVTQNGKEEFIIDKIEIVNKNGLDKVDRFL